MTRFYRQFCDRGNINKKQQLRWSHREEVEINYSGFRKQILTGSFSKSKIPSEIIQLSASEIQCFAVNSHGAISGMLVIRSRAFIHWFKCHTDIGFLEFVAELIAALQKINHILQSKVNFPPTFKMLAFISIFIKYGGSVHDLPVTGSDLPH